VLGIALLLAPGLAAAQPMSPDAEAPDLRAEADTALPPVVRYIIPDFGADRRVIPELNTRIVTARLGIDLIADWTSFNQNPASLVLHGQQHDQFEVRSARVLVVGKLLDNDRLLYRFAAQYRGFDIDPQRNWDVTDASLSWLFNSRGSRISAGQIRETFSYETLANTATTPTNERVINVFAAARNIGVSATHVFGAARDWTASIGLYRDSFGFSGSGAGATARLTHLLWADPDGSRYLHLGAAWRHRPDDDGTIRYRGRPGSNVADNFVDTGEFVASGANHFGVEALWNSGGMSVLGEYVLARVSAPDHGNPWFQGFYVTGSWVLTGEHRPYDRTSGLARRLVPVGRWGAPEIVARYAAVDLDSRDIRGGSFDRIEVGLNWWATSRWKLGLSAGRIWSRRAEQRGRTDNLLLRLQYIY
jgi:phosphate-selective porin OprO/OprP